MLSKRDVSLFFHSFEHNLGIKESIFRFSRFSFNSPFNNLTIKFLVIETHLLEHYVPRYSDTCVHLTATVNRVMDRRYGRKSLRQALGRLSG